MSRTEQERLKRAGCQSDSVKERLKRAVDSSFLQTRIWRAIKSSQILQERLCRTFVPTSAEARVQGSEQRSEDGERGISGTCLSKDIPPRLQRLFCGKLCWDPEKRMDTACKQSTPV